MKTASTAYVKVKSTGKKFTFDGVVSISHALTLKVSTDSDSSTGSDYVNNARNEPDVVTLAVVSSDVINKGENKKKATIRDLAEIKEKRQLCKLYTNLRTYKNMLLTDISVLQDETCPYGWTGTLTFTHTDPPATGSKPNNNSSTPSATGNTSGGEGNSGAYGSGGSSADPGYTHFTQIMNHASIMM